MILECEKRKWLWVAAIAFVMILLYSISCTRSGLWYDEGIEYWYSKVISGPVPGGGSTTSMYERIASTYQPPLYNVMMHLWLTFFPGEFAFRLAGVLISVLGGIGVYFAVKELCGFRYGLLSMAAWLILPPVAYYAMECAEYNLMMAFLAWQMFFFIRCLKTEGMEGSHGWLYNYIFFLLFSVLAVYSQYGAAFAVVATALVLLIKQVTEKEYKRTFAAIGMDAVAVIAAGIPLVVFFLLPQMEKQGSISHGSNALSFEGNIAIDFIKTMGRTFLYLAGGTAGSTAVKAFFCIMFIVLVACLVALLIKRDKMGWLLGMSCAAAFVLYWLLSGLSLYAYNAGGGRAYMVRYILFLEPMLAITLLYAGWRIVMMIEGKVHASLVHKAAIVCAAVITIIGGINITHTSIKDDVREAVQTYLNKGDENLSMIVHYWSYPTAAFYLNEGGVRQDKLKDLTVLERPDSVESGDTDGSSEEYQNYIEGLVSDEDFYYIGPKNDSLDLFLETVKNRESEYIYDGDSTVLLLVKEAE